MAHDTDPHRSALFTDLYELTMLGAYHAEGMQGSSVFELFFRELPPHRNYVIAAGLDEVLAYLENLRFTDSDIEFLAAMDRFEQDFLESLASFRFTGDVYAVPEGTPVFPNEPLVQVVAPIPQAQLVETYVINQMHIQSLAATKAARIARTAGDRMVADFGSRRAHGTDAALKIARAGYLGGIAGTSNVLASRLYDVPCLGTMAHSYVEAHDDEAAAFEAFSASYPGTTLLVDTYDTLEGVRRVIEQARRQGEDFDVDGVRLDSGDLADLLPRARALLDEAGLTGVKLIASGGLDEHGIRALIEAGHPVDGFGVGTQLVVSGDSPHIDLAYKLVEYEHQPRMKLSTGKTSLPGQKQVTRHYDDGECVEDVLVDAQEHAEGEPLLVQVMSGGKRTPQGHWTLEEARTRCARGLDALPGRLHALQQLPARDAYPVSVSDTLAESGRRISAGLKEASSAPSV